MQERTRRLYRDDCLNVLRDMEKESVDLIYLDPPFNSNAIYNLPFEKKSTGTSRAREREREREREAVAAFVDTWTWTEEDERNLQGLRINDPDLASVVETVDAVYRHTGNRNMTSYVLNMAIRLRLMTTLLKNTGSIYLHCDPTASPYLRTLMDAIFGPTNFRNELVWYYKNASRGKRQWAKSHDVILWYAKVAGSETFNRNEVLVPFESGMTEWRYSKGGQKGKTKPKGKTPDDVITLPALNAMAKERLGYPTQKPLALLERIIRASSHEGDVVLDPFCGCGTTLHAAESLNRQWLGIDISAYSASLVMRRMLDAFKMRLSHSDIRTYKIPRNPTEAWELAQERGPRGDFAGAFEVEKWICAELKIQGMGKKPGARGADAGIDGVLRFTPAYEGRMFKSEKAIVQVKAGKVTANAVKALNDDVHSRDDVEAGIFICFDQYRKTADKWVSKAVWDDVHGTYPRVQVFTIEDFFRGVQIKLPNLAAQSERMAVPMAAEKGGRYAGKKTFGD